MSLLSKERSGTIVLRKEISSKIEFSNSFSGKLELESDIAVSDFLKGSGTFVVRKLDFRFLPVNSSLVPDHGYGRLDIDFSSSYSVSNPSSDSTSSSTVTSRYRQTFAFLLKFASPSFPISYNKLLYRQYSTRGSSGADKFPAINYKLDTSGFQSDRAGLLYVDWVISKTVETTQGDIGDDANDT